jgi:hypothetical protein
MDANENGDTIRGLPKFIGISPKLRPSVKYGHYFPVAEALQASFKKIGFGSVYLGMQQVVEQTPEWLLPTLPPDLKGRQPSIKSLLAVLRDCSKHADGPTCFHSYEGNPVIAGILTAAALSKNEFMLSVVNLRGEYLIFRNRYSRLFISTYFRTLVRLSAGRLVISAESERLAKMLSARWGLPMLAYPVYSVHVGNEDDGSVHDRSYTILLARTPKDHELLISALRKVSRDIGHLVLFEPRLHLSDPPVADTYRSLGVEVVDHRLDAENYRALFRQAKRVVFVYTGNFYKTGSSGRLLDALLLGAAVAVPKDTALQDVVADLPHDAFTLDVDSLTTVLTKANSSPKERTARPCVPGSDTAADWLVSIWTSTKFVPVRLARLRSALAVALVYWYGLHFKFKRTRKYLQHRIG